MQGNPPVNTTDPSLSGTARDGQALTLDDGDWSGTPALVPAYQWQRCDASGNACADIAGETGLSYALQGADVGHTVRAVVTVTNAWGEASEAADPSAVVLAAPPAVTIDPSVTGTAVDGQTVSADPGVWAGTGPVDFTYQWLRCDLDGTNCTDIAGATDEDYTLTSDDADHGIRVEVTGTNAAGSATGTSPVAAVNALAPQNTAPPDDLGLARRRPHADRRRRHLVRHHAAALRLPVAALRRRRHELRGDPGGDRHSYDADRRRHRPRDPRLGHRPPTRPASPRPPRRPRATRVEADPPHAVTAPAVTGSARGRRHAERRHRQLDAAPPDRLHVPVAALRRRRHATAPTSRAPRPDTYTLTSDDVGHAVRVAGHRHQRRRRRHRQLRADRRRRPPRRRSARPPPSIAGVTVDGQTLTADHGSFSGTGPLDYDVPVAALRRRRHQLRRPARRHRLDLRPRLQRRRRRDARHRHRHQRRRQRQRDLLGHRRGARPRAHQRHPAVDLRRRRSTATR